jgi:hypothetical protein
VNSIDADFLHIFTTILFDKLEFSCMKKLFIYLIYTVFFAIISKFIYTEFETLLLYQMDNKGGVEFAIKNYKKNVDSLAAVFNLPPDYLMAVIMLESSGRKNVPARYEKSIYEQLKQLQNGKIEKFENLTQSDLKGVKDKTLKALATSYGPFQIMGYKKYILNVTLDSIKGNKNMYYAIKWINMSYGDMIRKGEYRDAFHFHNVGRRFPEDGKTQTHDPDYVENGLRYQKYFSRIIYKNK